MSYFNNCFVVDDLRSPFFKEGDSGSGVFLLDKTSQTVKALGIAFARKHGSQQTLVCKLNPIAKEFKLLFSNEMIAAETYLVQKVEEKMETDFRESN